MLKYLVITKIDSRDLYADVAKRFATDEEEMVSLPVFTLGEVLIVDSGGREVVGAQRKPSKWYVDYEGFVTVEQAVQRAQEVLAEHWKEIA